ncbi:MAG: hypothetical protein Q8S84_08220 [bacterium]|nr:hypothetical protein [bacterium]MDP3381420.1 hypothetical protein [bacterium]
MRINPTTLANLISKTPLNSPLPAKDWTRIRGDEATNNEKK